MLEKKELPSEYVSIRQIWLQNIMRCCEAISNRSKPDASHEANFQQIGDKTVVYSVRALYYSLVDYGEAILKSEIDDYKLIHIDPLIVNNMVWGKIANVYEKFYVKIIEVLNKYNMLFEQGPEGYSNVIMEVI